MPLRLRSERVAEHIGNHIEGYIACDPKNFSEALVDIFEGRDFGPSEHP